MASAADGAQKLALVFKPMLDELKKELKEHITTASQEVLLAIGKVEGRVDVLEKLVGEKKKTTTRCDKKNAGTTASTDASVNAGAEVRVQHPVGTQKNFPVNKLVYFRDQFKTNPEYRARYVTDDIQALMDKDATIMGKANETQKLIAQATFCWNYFKQNKPDIAETIEREYVAAKAAQEAANKPPQQTVEANTPPANAQ